MVDLSRVRQSGPLAPFASGFAATLAANGYTPHGAVKQLHLFASLSRWLGKKVTPYVPRHSTAIRLLHAGVGTTVIALWLGHEQDETTRIYLHADLTIKRTSSRAVGPLDGTPGRYRPPDKMLAFLQAL